MKRTKPKDIQLRFIRRREKYLMMKILHHRLFTSFKNYFNITVVEMILTVQLLFRYEITFQWTCAHLNSLHSATADDRDSISQKAFGQVPERGLPLCNVLRKVSTMGHCDGLNDGKLLDRATLVQIQRSSLCHTGVPPHSCSACQCGYKVKLQMQIKFQNTPLIRCIIIRHEKNWRHGSRNAGYMQYIVSGSVWPWI